MLRAPNEIARLVVSAAGRAEREFFSDFAGRPAARQKAGKTLRAQRAQRIVFMPAFTRRRMLVRMVGWLSRIVQFAEIDDRRQDHRHQSYGRKTPGTGVGLLGDPDCGSDQRHRCKTGELGQVFEFGAGRDAGSKSSHQGSEVKSNPGENDPSVASVHARVLPEIHFQW
jgi:hypothetical protein